MRRRAFQLGIAVLVSMVVVVVALVGSATPQQRGADPQRVISKSDPATAKLDDALQAKVKDGATGTVPVFVNATGDLAGVKALLDDDATAQVRGKAIIVGRISVQALPKLAGAKGVSSVGLVELKQTGKPLGVPDPLLNQRPTKAQLKARHEAMADKEVPFSKAPKLAGSHFDELKKLGVLDAKTHDFASAWRAGYAGEGTTVGVLDGGTDFGHPDLIGTWQTWSGATDSPTVDDGWNGWPKAFDPFDTLVWLVDPARVDLGLSWYTKTQPKTCAGGGSSCHVDFATRTGPSRNFNAPSGTVTHSYSFPRNWSKSGTVKLGSHPDDYLLQLNGERAAFLVVDAKTAGVYDTVYVDLDNDHRFDDEKPVTKGSPASYRDLDGDGVTDLSGGLLYYISDGSTRIPGGLTSFLGPDTPAPASGDLLAWSGDYDTGIEGHGTLTASNIVGQAVINGKTPSFDDLRTRDGRVPGAVIGGSPHAKLAPYGDIYLSFDFSTQFGYLLSTIRGVDVTSNSYGNSDRDNDGFDAASQEADIIHDGSVTTPLFSTGNGAPGYGTTTGPSPSGGIKVGASTQFGATGWDSIANIGQVVDDDVMVWSNRGPGATGSPGVDIVADGAFSSGDITLNSVLDGDTAWETWGGTSRSAPVAASATALIYQAYRKAHPGALPGGFNLRAKNILKSSADDLGYDGFTQGAGSIDAGRAVKTAAGGAATVSPDEWRVGDYRGDNDQAVFPRVIAPGASDTQTFTINGPGTFSVSDRFLRRTDRETFKFNSSSVKKETAFNFNAPDYLLDITDRVKRHPKADLMVVRAIYPHNQFDGDANYETDQDWRLLTYNWTDINRDHDLWRDRDHDGVVDHTDKAQGTTIDGDALLDFRRSEMEKGEYVRFMYHRPGGNELTSFVRDPRKRMDDGVFVGFQHTTPNPAIDSTNFTIQIDWYENGDWQWLTTPSTASGSFPAKLSVPADTPYGMYDGAIVLSRSGDSTVVPVSVAVAAQPQQDADGNLTGALKFGGADVAAAQSNLTYNNGSVFGATDWTWRPESGDWRFFYYDVAHAPPAGTLFLADTTWADAAPFTDLDTLIFGRSENSYQLVDPGPFGGPYILDTVGKSENTNVGAGVWTFDTATGGAREVVTAPAQEGLQALVQHQVGWDGGRFDVPFSTTLGSASVTPAAVEQSTAADTGSFDVTFKASVDLDGLAAEGFGLSQPQVTQEPVTQDNPDDPSTAGTKKNLTLNHASRLHVDTVLDQDVDLYVVYDANNDGTFSPDEIVAASATGSGDEAVDLIRPADGNYQIWLHGFAISGSPTLPLTVNAIQGNDLTVTGLPSGAVPAGTPVTLHVAFNKAMTAGQDYFGELLLGPAAAPTALTVPVKITRTP